MGHHSGHAYRTLKGLPEQISLYSRMGRCAVWLGGPCMRKNAEESAMARCGCSTQRGSAIVACARLREQCQESATTVKARRVSAVYWPVSSPASISGEFPPAPEEPSSPSASHPMLWGDWQRRSHRREVMKLLRHQRIDIRQAEPSSLIQSSSVRPLSRAERARYRLSRAERLARNACPQAAPDISIMLFRTPDAFATALGLRIA